MVGGMFAGVLMLPRVLAKIPTLAGFLTGILMLSGTRTQIQILAATLASVEIETLDGMLISDGAHAGAGEGELN